MASTPSNISLNHLADEAQISSHAGIFRNAIRAFAVIVMITGCSTEQPRSVQQLAAPAESKLPPFRGQKNGQSKNASFDFFHIYSLIGTIPKVDVRTFHGAYRNDAVLAARRYKDQPLIVFGPFKSADTTPGKQIVLLSANNSEVRALMASERENNIPKVEIGTIVYLACRVGEVNLLGYGQLHSCYSVTAEDFKLAETISHYTWPEILREDYDAWARGGKSAFDWKGYPAPPGDAQQSAKIEQELSQSSPKQPPPKLVQGKTSSPTHDEDKLLYGDRERRPQEPQPTNGGSDAAVDRRLTQGLDNGAADAARRLYVWNMQAGDSGPYERVTISDMTCDNLKLHTRAMKYVRYSPEAINALARVASRCLNQ